MADKFNVPANSARAEIIKGLRQLADYLDQNSHVPVNKHGWEFCQFTAHNDVRGKAEVDDVAEMLGEDVIDDTPYNGHYSASKSFGPVCYRMIFVSQRRLAENDALMSYRGSITPESSEKAA
jgi:hypothetical protein